MATFTRRPQQVAAIKLTYGGTLITDPATTPPTVTSFNVGDWLVWRQNGKAEIVKDARFRELYQPAAGDTVAAAMYDGTVDPNAS